MDRRDQKPGYDDWRQPAKDLLKRGILALLLENQPEGLTLERLKRLIAGNVEDPSHDRSVDGAIRDLIADCLVEENGDGLLLATPAVRAFDELGL